MNPWLPNLSRPLSSRRRSTRRRPSPHSNHRGRFCSRIPSTTRSITPRARGALRRRQLPPGASKLKRTISSRLLTPRRSGTCRPTTRSRPPTPRRSRSPRRCECSTGSLQGGVALGWDGLGEGLERGAAQAIAVPLAAESVFKLVVSTRSHYLGAIRKTQANIRFLAQAGKKVPLSAVLLPILFRGRVSHLLYLDNGHKQQAPTDIGEMLILAQKVTQTVDALVAKKQQEKP
jgi:hypothetical protein